MSEDERREPQQQNHSSTSGKNENDVCRDYLNNICNRGEKCRFYHPPNEEGKPPGDTYNFCIDFQASYYFFLITFFKFLITRTVNRNSIFSFPWNKFFAKLKKKFFLKLKVNRSQNKDKLF